MLCGSFAFAVMSTLARAIGDECSWPLIALSRSFWALVLAALFARAVGARFVLFRPRTLWLRSIAGSVSMLCTFYALTQLPVSDVLTLTNMFPIWVAILSWPLLGESPAARVWIAVVSAMAGVALIQQPHFAEGNEAVLLALLSSLSTAVAMIGLNRLQGIDVRAIVVHFSAVSVLFCLAALGVQVLLGEPVVFPQGPALWMLLGVGLCATVGQLCLTKAFASGPAAKVSVIGMSQIVFAMILEVLILDRSFNALTLLGMGLVVTPCCWLMIARKGRRRLPSALAARTRTLAPVAVGDGLSRHHQRPLRKL
jgi:drug/metabolite transporter (DMT)-like permease